MKSEGIKNGIIDSALELPPGCWHGIERLAGAFGIHFRRRQATHLPMNAHFATTRWSLVRSAASGAEQRSEALSELYTLYWKPICDYIRRIGVHETEVEDVAQDFFIGFFEGQTLHRADREVGKFRAYLAGALWHYVQKVWRKAGRQKRGGGKELVPLQNVEQSAAQEEDPARLFDLEWAQTVVAHSMRRLEKENLAQGLDAATTDILIQGNAGVSQKETAAQMGISVTALKTRVFRTRRRFRVILREEVGRTVSSESDLEDELAYLLQILGGPAA